MKIIILSNDLNSFVKPVAEGLSRMMQEIGLDPVVYTEGHDLLDLFDRHKNGAFICKNFIKKILNMYYPNRYDVYNIRRLNRCRSDIFRSDLIVVVSHVPGAFIKTCFPGIEYLRQCTQAPIVLYDLVNLATRRKWIDRIRERGGYGLERYDWYLAASVVSELPMPREFQAYSLIGMNLISENLHPDQVPGDFLALVDFPRKGYEKERELQLQALKETGTRYLMLNEPLTISEIRALYRKTSLFFLSFRESFGLPIVELQLCGAKIATPYKNWAPSHYINKGIFSRGEGDLNRNFIVYENDLGLLKEKIQALKRNHNPQAVIDEFKTTTPHLYQGDLKELIATKLRYLVYPYSFWL
jgi:hypothetical protein